MPSREAPATAHSPHTHTARARPHAGRGCADRDPRLGRHGVRARRRPGPARDRAPGATTGSRGLWQETESATRRGAGRASPRRSAKIDGSQDELARIRASLNDRVAAAFMSGGSRSIGALLTSDSIQDAADRLQYTQSVVQGDADLATEVAVMAEELRRQESAAPATAARKEARAVGRARDAPSARRSRQVRAAERRGRTSSRRSSTPIEERSRSASAVGGSSITGTGAIQTCPVAGPNSFVDSFGDPRPGRPDATRGST